MEIEKRVHFISNYVSLLEPEEIDWLHFKLICDHDISPCIKKTNKGDLIFDEDLLAIKQANIIHRLSLLRLSEERVSLPPFSDGEVYYLKKPDE
jgi:hypothetical protein